MNFQQSLSKRLSTLAAAYVIAAGVLSFLGWTAGIPRLTDWWATGVTIKANAALAFTAAGSALLGLALWPSAKRSIRISASFAALLGLLTLFQHLTGLDLHIDTLLFDEAPGAPGTASPGRMGPPASMSVLMLGIALVLLTTGQARIRRLSSALAIATLGLGTLSITGYLYGAETMYAVPRLTGIAIQTATMIVVLSAGVIAAQPEYEPMKTLCGDDTASRLARRLIPAAFIVPLALGWMRIAGDRTGFYDEAFGTALRTLFEMAILGGVFWWIVLASRTREIQERRAEEERHSSERRLQLVLEASAVPFTLLSPVRDPAGAIVDFSVTYLNPAAARVLDMEPREVTGRSVTNVLAGTWGKPSAFDAYVAVVLRNEVREFELSYDNNGSQGWFQIVASPLDGNVAVWSADVSERKRQELELRNADRLKDEFLATLAHELRNPLAPIRQAATLAKQPAATDSQRQWCNQVIERQVQHMSLLLDDLLDVSRITRGTLELRKQPTSLADLVSSGIETTRPLIERKNHALEVHVPAEPVQVQVDVVRMSQIISNLLNNAAKYTDPGGTIQLRAEMIGRDLLLKVTDNGIGIAAEELQRMFRMFSQLKSAQERSEGGLGIGLALTKGLVELHGGIIEAYSAGPGTGSTFTVKIPHALSSTGAEDLPVGARAHLRTRRRILLADDNRDAAESLAMLLKADGHEVVLACDGVKALNLYATFAPDVVLLDIGMPHMSGYEVASRIRAENPSVLLVAITGWGQSSDRKQSASAGFDHHLTKPVDYVDLVQLL